MNPISEESPPYGQLVYLSEILSSKYAVTITDEVIKKLSIFQDIQATLKSSSLVELYFSICIKFKIYPEIFNIIRKDWSKYAHSLDNARLPTLKLDIPHDQLISHFMQTISTPMTEVYKKEWLYNVVKHAECDPLLKLSLFNLYYTFYNSIKLKKIDRLTANTSTMAINCFEALDLSKRSDFLANSTIDVLKKNVLIIYEDLGKLNHYEKIKLLELTYKYGFRGICLRDYFKGIPLWIPKFCYYPKNTILIKNPGNKLECWIQTVGKKLIREAYYWKHFIDTFNIKIMFVKNERRLSVIARTIAFNLGGEKTGFLVARQKSELFYPPTATLGTPAKDILFSWNERSKHLFTPNIEHIKLNVISGYEYSDFFKRKQVEVKTQINELKYKNVSFLVALFDNTFGGMTNPFTLKMVEEFYQTFINWAVDDKNIGLVIKSKKEGIIERLSSGNIKKQLLNLEKSGRCVIFNEQVFPAEVARYCDFSVGFGISSALTEVVLQNIRGVQCDLSKCHTHEFYKWGYDEIIFDDIERLIIALKKFKENPDQSPKLGDWSSYLNYLDPFRDGSSSLKIGYFLNQIVQGFDEGLSAEAALRKAAGLYSQKWGAQYVQHMTT